MFNYYVVPIKWCKHFTHVLGVFIYLNRISLCRLGWPPAHGGQTASIFWMAGTKPAHNYAYLTGVIKWSKIHCRKTVCSLLLWEVTPWPRAWGEGLFHLTAYRPALREPGNLTAYSPELRAGTWRQGLVPRGWKGAAYQLAQPAFLYNPEPPAQVWHGPLSAVPPPLTTN